MKRKEIIVSGVVIIVMIGAILGWKSLNKNSSPAQPNYTASTPTPTQGSATSATYSGTLPCADCSGVDTKLTLNSDPNSGNGTYTLESTYEGKDLAPVITNGNYTTHKGNSTDPNATIIELDYDKLGQEQYYKVVDPDHLQMLDRNQNEIQSPVSMILTKE